ncbi:hypothetical protein [Pantoea sp. CTOTU50773]|uniref:hypothetical protein n=1 Tax=Pantoea sp. CTOTU50773 TaxID=2953853 RepID=UPI0028AED9E6|nr:hypothetical protein [Pantoea sp. CTOTU50773]
MSAFPYYVALALLVCVALVWSGLILDLFGMRCWMHHVTDFMETQLKGSEPLQ